MPLAPVSFKSVTADFGNLDASAANPVRVKFMSGFNTGIRHAREGKPNLDGVSRAGRSVPFLAGYDIARIVYRLKRPNTSREVTAALDEEWRKFVSTNTGTNMAWDSKIRGE